MDKKVYIEELVNKMNTTDIQFAKDYYKFADMMLEEKYGHLYYEEDRILLFNMIIDRIK